MKLFFKMFIVMFMLVPGLLMAEEQPAKEGREVKTISLNTKAVEGKLKAGAVIGYPVGITAGYRFSDLFELNGVIGSNFSDFSLGVNGLFTIVNLEISREIFPVSIGPAVYTHFWHEEGNNKNGKKDEYVKVDLLGVARGEYDFKEIPLNLFVEIGLGLELVRFTDFAGSLAIGVRYIF